MLDPDVLSPDDERLLPWVMAIADGTPVDWSAATFGTTPPPLNQPPPSRVLIQLQYLERLVRGHEAARSGPSRRLAASADETLLTEARRKGGLVEHPLRVQWGPLIVLEKIGRGSFGDVYRAWDPRLDREVALKLIPEDTSESAASPVVEEGRLLARVRHPNVMVVHGAERIDGRVGIWTEYVRGETLASEIVRRGPLSADEAAQIGVDVCAALGAVHAAGLLHRDVKAQNILRDATGRIALGDFGTGIELAADAGVSDPQIAGTPLYLAPEVIEGKPATIASDLYAVGVLLYLLVTGNYPVAGRTLAEIKRAHATGEHLALLTARPDLPDALIHIIETLLATDPGERYQTAGASEAALRGWLEQPSAAKRPLRGRLAMAAVGAVVLAAALGGAVWRSGWLRPAADTPQRAAPFTLKAGDWIVVADFDNQTGESVLDRTLQEAVERELEYSDFVRVAQRDRIEDALKLLQRPLDSRLTTDLALHLSQRDGGLRAVISGRITKADPGYTLTFAASDPASQTAVAHLSDHAAGHADILGVVRNQTLRIRQALGEPAASIERSRQAFQHAALPSLKALHLYAQARAMVNLRGGFPLSGWVKVEKIAREALQEDARFPLGHNLLFWALTNQRRIQEAQVHVERALLLADSATPQERYFIIAGFHTHKARGRGSGPAFVDRQELEKAAAAMEALFALQPDHYGLRNNMRHINRVLGRERDLAWMNLRLADARPWSVRANVDVANDLLREGNIEGARRYGARAESALSPGSAAAEPDLAAAVRLFHANVAWVQTDLTETLRLLDQVAASAGRLPQSERHAQYLRLWALYAAVGRLREAEKAIEAARAGDGNDSAEAIVVDMARASLFEDHGDLNGLREFAATRWREPLSTAARAWRVPFLIEAGLLDAAERDLEWFKQRTAQTSEWAPRPRPTRQFEPFYASNAAALELARGRPAEAVGLLRKAMPAIRDVTPPLLTLDTWQRQYAAVKLAEALEASGRVPEAIATLEEVVSNRVAATIANTPNRWLRTSAQLARLYRKNGQEEKARAVEAQLSKLLVEADAGHPLVVELARRR